MDKPLPETIQAGIVGTGFIGPVHLEALRRNNIPVIGLAEQTAARAARRAAALGIDKAYPSYEAMLADPQIDVVHLTTPNSLHFSQAKAALLAGKHVVCEKPLALTSQESAELVRLAAETGRVNAINFNQRYYPLVQQARAMVQSGELGKIFIIQGSYLQDWLLLPTDWNWRLEPSIGGSLRAVADIGSHWLDMMTFITGLRVQSVLADLQTFIHVRKKPTRPIHTFAAKLKKPTETVDQPISTEDYASILLHYDQDARGVLTVTQVAAGRKNRLFFEINASKTSLSWDAEHPNDLWIGRREAPNGLLMKDPSLLAPEARSFASYPGGHQEGFADTFKQLVGRVYRYIQAGDFSVQPDFPTFADGHEAMLLNEAIQRSATEKCWVEVAGSIAPHPV